MSTYLRKSKPFIRLQPTREGKRFILIIAVLTLAALNTGNNLMYLILSMLLSMGFLSLIIPIVNLKGLSISLKIDEPIFADTPTLVKLKLINHKRFPSFSLKISTDIFKNNEEFYVKKIAPYGETLIQKQLCLKKRGIYNLTSVRIITSFPFIFFQFIDIHTYEKQIIVYPKLIDIDDISAQWSSTTVLSASIKSSSGDYPHSLRKYIEGDPIKYIHWKASAKLDTLMVKEFYKEKTQRVSVVLDNGSSTTEELFERAVSICASVLVELFNMGIPFRLITMEKAFPYGTGMSHLMLQMDWLATVKLKPYATFRLTEVIQEPVILVLPDTDILFETKFESIIKTYYASRL